MYEPMTPKMTVAEFLSEKINASRHTQADIASAMGFKRPHMISMLKTGRTRLPFDRIRSLARALEIDHRDLARRAIAEYQPELLTLLDEIHQQALPNHAGK